MKWVSKIALLHICVLTALQWMGTYAHAEDKVPPVEAKAFVDKAVATTGDVITYTIEVTHRKNISIQLKEPGADIAGLRIIDAGMAPKEEANGRITEKRWYQLRADLVGSYVLPPVRVQYEAIESTKPKTPDGVSNKALQTDDSTKKDMPTQDIQAVQTSQIFIEVQSVLPEDQQATDIRDIKPLERVDYGIAPWIIAVAVGGCVLFLMVVLVLYRKRKQPISIKAALPNEIAFAALDALRQTDFADKQALLAYYFQLSEVLRTYVEAQYGLNATDLTSEEILTRVSDLPGLASDEKACLEAFLKATDRVRFALEMPNQEEIKQTYEHALHFVETTCNASVHPEPSNATQGGSA